MTYLFICSVVYGRVSLSGKSGAALDGCMVDLRHGGCPLGDERWTTVLFCGLTYRCMLCLCAVLATFAVYLLRWMLVLGGGDAAESVLRRCTLRALYCAGTHFENAAAIDGCGGYVVKMMNMPRTRM
jgi:hypothetical protein